MSPRSRQARLSANGRRTNIWDQATFAVTLISREDTVNLGNMNVISEKTYDASHEETTGAISGLSKWISSLSIVPDAAKALVTDQPSTSIDTPSGKWKITKFATTPLVSDLSIV
jgi:aminopeptidase 2